MVREGDMTGRLGDERGRYDWEIILSLTKLNPCVRHRWQLVVVMVVMMGMEVGCGGGSDGGDHQTLV